jgi:hypothetical protein
MLTPSEISSLRQETRDWQDQLEKGLREGHPALSKWGRDETPEELAAREARSAALKAKRAKEESPAASPSPRPETPPTA